MRGLLLLMVALSLGHVCRMGCGDCEKEGETCCGCGMTGVCSQNCPLGCPSQPSLCDKCPELSACPKVEESEFCAVKQTYDSKGCKKCPERVCDIACAGGCAQCPDGFACDGCSSGTPKCRKEPLMGGDCSVGVCGRDNEGRCPNVNQLPVNNPKCATAVDLCEFDNQCLDSSKKCCNNECGVRECTDPCDACPDPGTEPSVGFNCRLFVNPGNNACPKCPEWKCTGSPFLSSCNDNHQCTEEGYECYWSQKCDENGENCEAPSGDDLCHPTCDTNADCPQGSLKWCRTRTVGDNRTVNMCFKCTGLSCLAPSEPLEEDCYLNHFRHDGQGCPDCVEPSCLNECRLGDLVSKPCQTCTCLGNGTLSCVDTSCDCNEESEDDCLVCVCNANDERTCFDKCASSERLIVRLEDLTGLTLPILQDILYAWRESLGSQITSYKLFDVRFNGKKISAYLSLNLGQQRNTAAVDIELSLATFMQASGVEVGRVSAVEGENSQGASSGLIAGAVVGGLVFVALVVVLVVVVIQVKNGDQLKNKRHIKKSFKGSRVELDEVELD